MLRYLAIATIIVVLAVVGMLQLGRFVKPLQSRYTSHVAPAASPRPEATSNATVAPVSGAAPWALSALPGCFVTHGSLGGSSAFVRARARTLAPGPWHRVVNVRLRSGDCELSITGHAARVVRGDTRLTIPPDARFFVAGKRLVLHRVADGRTELRAYELRDGTPPRFTAL